MRWPWLILGVSIGGIVVWSLVGSTESAGSGKRRPDAPDLQGHVERGDTGPTLASAAPSRPPALPVPSSVISPSATSESAPPPLVDEDAIARRVARLERLATAWLTRLRRIRDARALHEALTEVVVALRSTDPEQSLAALSVVGLAPRGMLADDETRAAVRRWLTTDDSLAVLFALEALGAIGGDPTDATACATVFRSLPKSLRGRALAAMVRVGTLDTATSALAVDWWDSADGQRRELVDALRTVERIPPAMENRLLAAAAEGDEATQLQLLSGPLASASPKSAPLTRLLLTLVEKSGDIGTHAIQALRSGVGESERGSVVMRMLELAEDSESAVTRQLALHVVSAQGDESALPRVQRIMENPRVDTGTRSAAEHALTRIRQLSTRRSN